MYSIFLFCVVDLITLAAAYRVQNVVLLLFGWRLVGMGRYQANGNRDRRSVLLFNSWSRRFGRLVTLLGTCMRFIVISDY